MSRKIRAQLTEEVRLIREADGAVPTLAVVLVGSRRDSQQYVSMKTRACAEVGIAARQLSLPEATTTEELLRLIDGLNADEAVNGILVQLPLPAHCSSERVIAALHPAKDVDGLTQASAGALSQQGSAAPLIPCTPLGCIALLDHYGLGIAGRHAVVLGRSNLVGKPLAALLLHRNATVTTVHSQTPQPERLIAQADIVVAAIGKAEWLRGDWLKPGAVVLDVGINARDDPSRKAGYRMLGDVHFDSACSRCSAISPVPGGVGPMTVAMLIRNTVTAYRMQRQSRAG